MWGGIDLRRGDVSKVVVGQWDLHHWRDNQPKEFAAWNRLVGILKSYNRLQERLMWQEKVFDSPLIKEFIKKFGGQFGILPDADVMFYEVGRREDSQAYKMPTDATEFWTLISKSIKDNKNLLLSLPRQISRS